MFFFFLVTSVGQRIPESEGLRFDSSWELKIFSLSQARDETKKNPPLSFSIKSYTKHNLHKYVKKFQDYFS